MLDTAARSNTHMGSIVPHELDDDGIGEGFIDALVSHFRVHHFRGWLRGSWEDSRRGADAVCLSPPRAAPPPSATTTDGLIELLPAKDKSV